MRKFFKFYQFISVGLIICLFSGGALRLGASSSTRQELEEAKQEANRVSSEINANQEALETLENQKNNISGQLSSYNNQLTEAINALNDTEFAIRAKELEIEQKLEELDNAKKVEQQQYTDLMGHLRYMYESGVTQSYLNLVTESTSLADFLNLSEYVEKISAYDVKMLEEFRMLREYVEKEESILQQEREQLQQLRVSQEEKRNQVKNLVHQTQSALANKEGEINQKENEVTAQQEALEKIKDNIKELQEKLERELAMSQEAANAEWRDISQVEFSEDDEKMLANLIYCEARGESYDGMLAVGSVVVNRILSSKYPSTMAGVIYQRGQFEPVSSTRNSFVEALAYDKAANSKGCYQAAREAMSGITNVKNCVYFQTIEYLERVERLHVVRYVIGNHGFY